MSRLVLLLTGLLCAASLPAAPSPDLENCDERFRINDMHGKPSPAWQLRDWMNSSPLELKGLEGKIVVLDFWATWCVECVRSIPRLNALQTKYAKAGVVIIGVCAPEGGERMADVVRGKGIRYPVAVDRGGVTNRRYLANSSPDYYIIDRQGRLRWGDFANRHVEKAIQILLAEDRP